MRESDLDKALQEAVALAARRRVALSARHIADKSALSRMRHAAVRQGGAGSR